MSTALGLIPQPATETDVPRCMAMVPVADLVDLPAFMLPLGLVRCGLPASGWWQGSCPCGHVRDGWRCKPHEDTASDGTGGCLACLQQADSPHECPLPLSRVTPGGQS